MADNADLEPVSLLGLLAEPSESQPKRRRPLLRRKARASDVSPPVMLAGAVEAASQAADAPAPPPPAPWPPAEAPATPAPLTPPPVPATAVVADPVPATSATAPQGVPASAPPSAPTPAGRPLSPGYARPRQELLTQPLPGPRRVAVISLRGGSGRTTTVVCLGDALAVTRRSPVLAVDAVPHLGTLGGRSGVGAHCQFSAMDIAVHGNVYGQRGGTVPPTGRRGTGLYVLPGEQRVPAPPVLNADAYRYIATEVLPSHYPLMLTDTPHLLDGVMEAVLPTSDALLITATASPESVSGAIDALVYLSEHGYGRLARGAVLVVNAVRPQDPGLDLAEIHEWFDPRVRAIVTIPWDEHLAAGSAVDCSRLAPATWDAYLNLAAVTVSGLLPRKKD